MPEPIIAVTGFSRCGTSLVMRMLHAGGIPVVADNHVSYEDDRWQGMPKDQAWLEECRGKAVKLLEPMQCIPSDKYDYKWILMERNPVQQAKSQLKMLKDMAGLPGRGFTLATDRGDLHTMAKGIIRDAPAVRQMLDICYPRSHMLVLQFEEVLQNPMEAACKLAHFVDITDQLKIQTMACCVIPRSPKCYKGFLELRVMEEQGEA